MHVPNLEIADHQVILADLETLVRETYQLWDQEWVGFSWRNYTFDHVQRVRALTRTLCAREGGDVLVANYAGLLHDITKSYDG
jgi:HD superfamily phosphodiesterase